MGLKRIREDSIKELKKKKSNEQLAKENEQLKEQVSLLENDLANTQMALVEVFEQMVGISGGEL